MSYTCFSDGVDIDIIKDYVPILINPELEDPAPIKTLKPLRRLKEWQRWNIPSMTSIGKLIEKSSEAPITFLDPQIFEKINHRMYKEVPEEIDPDDVEYFQTLVLRKLLRLVYEDFLMVENSCVEFRYAENFKEAIKDLKKARMLYLCTRVYRISQSATIPEKRLHEKRRFRIYKDIIECCEETERVLTLISRAEDAYENAFPDYKEQPDSVKLDLAIDFFLKFSSSSEFERVVIKGRYISELANKKTTAEEEVKAWQEIMQQSWKQRC